MVSNSQLGVQTRFVLGFWRSMASCVVFLMVSLWREGLSDQVENQIEARILSTEGFQASIVRAHLEMWRFAFPTDLKLKAVGIITRSILD